MLVALKPPKDDPTGFWLGAVWPNAKTFCFAASGSACGAPNVKVLLLELVVAAVATGAAAVVVVLVVPN